MIRTSLNDEARVGDTVLYHLRSQDNPIDPLKIWHGRILDILLRINDRAHICYYHVQSLEYPDCDEIVYPEQIVGFEPLFIESEPPSH